ncbi:hypothetical protein NIES4102_02590 [Chondrocystis sp. NIES-4102]|nr:hypothetical protein NIES4102_02590 [Chondrocystis sp. NIES-4102]
MLKVKNKFQFHFLTWATIISTVILFTCSSLRHALFQSSFDLAIFDNAIYLISQGKEPWVSFRALHILGDHAAWILYAVAIPYKIYPDIHWLFLIQALSLSLGIVPIWYLTKVASLKKSQSRTICIAYLLYPLIFNVNLFDFHPEVIAVPTLLAAILAVQLNQLWWFITAVIVTLGCKAILSLTVVAMGFWLLILGKYRYGIIALILGCGWFAIATQVIIPNFSGTEAAAVDRYSYLGDSVFEIAKNLLFKPQLILGKIFSASSFEYLLLLTIPLWWGLSWRHLTPIIAASPILLVNLLSQSPAQRNLVHQYSLPILPWLFLIVIMGVSANDIWLKNQRRILIWSVIAFLILGKYGYFTSLYLQSWDTWQATKIAISQIDTSGSVLTTTDIAPHLTHRTLVGLTTSELDIQELAKFKYILLNLRHPGWGSSTEIAQATLEKLKQSPTFKLNFQQDDVFLFIHR